jgi:hypothetical protein
MQMSTGQTTPPVSENGASKEATNDGAGLRRTLLWLSIAGASAAVTFFAVRAMMRRAPVDPTSERIQALIDEANRLLRTLDDKKHD